MASFEIEVQAPKQTTFKRMELAVNEANGTFNGTMESGSFEIPVALGKIAGNYELYDDYILVDIKKKPFLVSLNMIEDALTGFIESEEE